MGLQIQSQLPSLEGAGAGAGAAEADAKKRSANTGRTRKMALEKPKQAAIFRMGNRENPIQRERERM